MTWKTPDTTMKVIVVVIFIVALVANGYKTNAGQHVFTWLSRILADSELDAIDIRDNPLPKEIADYLKKHGEITDTMIDILLSLSVKNAISDCLDLFPNWDDISVNRRMALIDFVFQLGKTKVLHFHHTIAAINTGRWEDAANHMRQSAWFRQVPKRAIEVTDLIEAG